MKELTKAQIIIKAHEIAEHWYCIYGLKNGYALCKQIRKIMKKEKMRRRKLDTEERKRKRQDRSAV